MVLAEVTLKNALVALLFPAGFFIPCYVFIRLYEYPQEKRNTRSYRLLAVFGKLCGLFWAVILVLGLISKMGEQKPSSFEDEDPPEPVYWNDRGR